MRFEVVENVDAWVVRSEGSELGRFADQDQALHDVADRLRHADVSAPVALSMRYMNRSA